MKKLVIMPGGFHPFHQGHLSLYNAAKRQFPDADVYVAATNDTSKRPFPFEIKAKLAQLAGVDPGHFIQVKSPFRPEEITKAYNPDDTELIYVRSEKDIGESPKPGGVKKDGSPAYLQPFNNQAIQPMSKHAYIAYLPTVEFAGGITSATEIRNRWPDLSEQQKVQLVNTLYPKTKQNKQLAANVIKLLNLAIQGNNRGINEDKICPVCGCTPCNCTHIVKENIEDLDYVQDITAQFLRKVQPMRSRITDRKAIIGLLDRFFDKFAIPEKYFDDVYHLAARRLESEQPVDESMCANHISPSGVETNMCPDDDDYEINYGKSGLVAKDRKSRGVDVATGEKKVKETKKQSTQQKFEKHLAKHGYDVAEKSKYWDQKIKDIDAQIAAWDAEMQRRKRENLPESIKRAIIEGGHSLEDFDYMAEKK